MNIDEVKIGNSALWASVADAMGWISELVDARGLRRRIGGLTVVRTVPWKRKIGGLSGINLDLPAGTYSDDTQLRLAVCRAIRSDGSFDVEAFAKIELPVWSTYCLGAGRGTKAAAANLLKRDVTWFSNFFSSRAGPSYVQGGGNGAAMRIQPHVWSNVGRLDSKKYLSNVIRDSLVTHGHMAGVCGAVFHARCLAHVFSNSRQAGPAEWTLFVSEFEEIEEIIRSDSLLAQFWLGAWEQSSSKSLKTAIDEVTSMASRYIEAIGDVSHISIDAYTAVLDLMECRGRYLGTGLNTALAAAYLAWSLPDSEVAVRQACNVLGSDTDTIATMTGALTGVLSPDGPVWDLQDREYILREAQRMYLVATGRHTQSFNYPDISTWRPPQTQADVIGSAGDRIAVRGLGFVEPEGEAVVGPSTVWHWFRLDFGQSILCKSKIGRLTRVAETQLPSRSMTKDQRRSPRPAMELPRSHSDQRLPRSPGLFDGSEPDFAVQHSVPRRETLDDLTDRVIRSNFDTIVLGECFKLCMSGPDSIERSVAFASIIAKAVAARRRKA